MKIYIDGKIITYEVTKELDTTIELTEQLKEILATAKLIKIEYE